MINGSTFNFYDFTNYYLYDNNLMKVLNFFKKVNFLRRSLKWFAVATTIGMIFVLLGGALVTKTDSGMGCGRSWPLCNGQFLPTEITPELIIELAHRVVSGSSRHHGAYSYLFGHGKQSAILGKRNFFLFFHFSFLLLQGLIGAAAVIWGQSDFVLALHFGISLISFAAVFLFTLLIFEIDKKFEAEKLIIDKRMGLHIISVSIYSYLVIYTGALVDIQNLVLFVVIGHYVLMILLLFQVTL